MVHILDRGDGLVLDYSLWSDPICCKHCSGLGCDAYVAKLGLKADRVRNGHIEFYRCLVWRLLIKWVCCMGYLYWISKGLAICYLIYHAPEKQDAMRQVWERVPGTGVLFRVIPCCKRGNGQDTLKALYDWTVEWPFRT